MTYQNQQDSSVITIDADPQHAHATPVGDAQQLALVPAKAAIGKSAAIESKAPSANRIFAYAGVAAIIGVGAGFWLASLPGHAAPRNEPSASASSNSNATAMAAVVNSQPTAPAQSIMPPVDLPAIQTPPVIALKPTYHKKAKKKDTDSPDKFAIEGDDELVGYDSSNGVIQTSARKTFLISKTVVGNSSAWQDWPANIHYKCDANSSCTLTRRGATVIYAQLKK